MCQVQHTDQICGIAESILLQEALLIASRRIADHNLRRSQGDGLRPAVVDGLLHAMPIYEALSPAQRLAVLVEVAAIGEKGLPVNHPGLSYSLETLSGTFTALELACLIDVGGRLVLGMDKGGFEFEAEYAESAKQLFGSSS